MLEYLLSLTFSMLYMLYSSVSPSPSVGQISTAIHSGRRAGTICGLQTYAWEGAPGSVEEPEFGICH